MSCTCRTRWLGRRRSRRLRPFVAVMKPTDFRYRHHPATSRQQDRARLWTIHGQRQMGPPTMVIRQVAGQDALEMPLMEDHHLVQTLRTNAPNQPLDKGVLPRTPGRSRLLQSPGAARAAERPLHRYGPDHEAGIAGRHARETPPAPAGPSTLPWDAR
jgi:hypothetical protein